MYFLENNPTLVVPVSAFDYATKTISVNDLIFSQYHWLYLLLCVLVGMLIGLRLTFLLREPDNKVTKADTQSHKHAHLQNTQEAAHSIDSVIRDLVNSQFIFKEQTSSAGSQQTSVRESIRQLRVISMYLQNENDATVRLEKTLTPNSDKRSKAPRSCEIKELVNEQFILAQAYLDGCDLSLFDEIEERVDVILPADWLRKAFRELIVNAVRHNKRKHGLRITLRVSKTDTHISVDVCDNGQGIPSSLMNAINQPSNEFKALQSLSNPELLPINLSAIQLYLLEQGGKLAITSARHFMTKISLQLPLASESVLCEIHMRDNNTLSTSQRSRLSEVNDEGKGTFNATHHFPNLLIVNLDQLPISNARTVLYQHFSIIDATSLADTIDIIGTQKVDCMLVDTGTTGTYMIDTLNFLRSHDKCKNIPSVIIGNEIDTSTQLKMLNIGTFGLMVHPVQGQQICEVLKNLLQVSTPQVGNINEKSVAYNMQDAGAQEGDTIEDDEDSAFSVRFQKVLETHYSDENFNRQAASSYMFLHERTLHRRLSEYYELSFTEMLKQYRLQVAKKMIESGENITTTAYQTGFSSPSYFAQCFKSFYGVQPSSISKQA